MATIPDKILIRQIQMRRDTPDNWNLHNPVLADGEFGVERIPESDPLNPSQFKIGNGVLSWSDLPYAGLVGPSGKDGVYAISPLANNRAKQDTGDNNSLYVPELQVDLADTYLKVLQEIVPEVDGLEPSERVLIDFTIAIGQDVRVIKEDLDKVSQLKKVAGEQLSALTCVYEINGVVRKLDYRDSVNIYHFLGITTTSADAGQTIKVQRVGQINDPFWNLTNDRVYLGANGTITQTPPEDGYDLLIGMATNPKTIVLNIQDPIELEN